MSRLLHESQSQLYQLMAQAAAARDRALALAADLFAPDSGLDQRFRDELQDILDDDDDIERVRKLRRLRATFLDAWEEAYGRIFALTQTIPEDTNDPLQEEAVRRLQDRLDQWLKLVPKMVACLDALEEEMHFNNGARAMQAVVDALQASAP